MTYFKANCKVIETAATECMTLPWHKMIPPIWMLYWETLNF